MKFSEININDIKDIAIKAGKAIMDIYSKDFDIEYKKDNSPITQADKISNEIICSSLENLYDGIPILSEENKEILYEIRKDWEYYWCIDPIDGTKEFIKKNGEFTVNIALIYKNIPVLGVVYAPAIGVIFSAKKGEGAFKEVINDKYGVLNKNKLPIYLNTDLKKSITVVASKSHMSEETRKYVDELSISTEKLTLVSKGSSLKLCMIATGEADIYPRLAPTMEWDTAAADAIIRESGKVIYHFKSNFLLQYNKEQLLNPWFICQ